MARTVDDALRAAEEAWEQYDFQAVLRHARAALALDPRSLDALELEAGALSELGEHEEADQAYRRLVELDPKDPATLLAAASHDIRNAEDDRDLLDEGLDLLDRAWPSAKKDESLRAELQVLRGLALNQLGECAEALLALDAALALDPENGEAQLERAMALFELDRLDDAERALRAITREWPEEAWAWHYLGLVAERRGQDPAPHFAQARALDADDFPAPQHLSPADFDAAVAKAIEQLPAHAREHLGNVVIDVQQLPGDEDVKEGVSPLILGIFRGKALDERSPTEAADHQTATITLFQKNLERFARSRDELIEEIGVTVLHEVGHLLGLDEDELYDRGLD